MPTPKRQGTRPARPASVQATPAEQLGLDGQPCSGAARRAAQKEVNLVVPEDGEAPYPQFPLYGSEHGTLILGARQPVELACARLNIRGTLAFQSYFENHYPARSLMPGLTIGRQIVDGCLMSGRIEDLVMMIRWTVMEPEQVTEEQVMDTDPEMLAGHITAFWEAAGLRMMEALAKKSTDAVWAAMVASIEKAAPGLGEALASRVIATTPIPGSAQPSPSLT